MNELRIELQPKQKLFRDAIENFPYTFYGGARGGGKSAGLRRIMLLRRFLYPGSHGAIFRRTYGELEGNHIRPLFEDYPGLKEYWRDQKKLLLLPNGSTLQFCHCSNETDVDLYQGREFHDLAIDEAGQWTESMFRRLCGSNRSSKENIKARAILTGNPGGIGHSWLKRLFVERRFNEREAPPDYAFVQAFVSDNKALVDNDPDYVKRLQSEPNEALRKAWLHGDWDIFAGQFFGEITRDVHMVRPFSIPDHWNRYGSYDFGFTHPAAFGWFTVDGDGNVYLYRELIRAGLRVDQFAQHLLEFDDTRDLRQITAGWDCWAKKSVVNSANPPTIAEEFLKHRLQLTRANIDRIQGASQMRNYLAWKDLASGRTQPKFFVFDTCPLSFDCLTRMQHDPNRPEDVLKVDASEGDPQTGDDCFIKGTLIATEHGQKPIESILPGDLVWTRLGLKPVVDAWLNSLSSETVKLTLSDGRELTATPNHKIWTSKGFVAIDTLRYGDILECLNQSSLSLTGSNLDGIPNLPAHTLETISGLVEITASEVWALCIKKFGRRLTEIFPQGTTFITPMGIHSTTNWRIWCSSILRTIASSISKTQLEWQRLENILNRLGPWLLPGIEAKLVESGTLKMLYAPQLNAKGSKHVVWCAPESFIQKIQKGLSSVAELVSKKHTGNQTYLGSIKNAQYVKRPSRHLNTTPKPPVAGYVEAVTDFKKLDTYSLHVSDCHEYFANGILVSNCYDMIRYFLMSRPPLTLEPKAVPKWGTPEWSKHTEDALFKHNVERIKREKADKDTAHSDRNWVVDKNGVPDWNQW